MPLTVDITQEVPAVQNKSAFAWNCQQSNKKDSRHVPGATGRYIDL